MVASSFVDMLADVDLPGVFNPYRDFCRDNDLPDAAKIRRENLRNFIVAAREAGNPSLWVGRDLGYLGGRRTGIALTDEAHISDLSAKYPDMRPLRKATRGPSVAERTATVFWRMIRQIDEAVFTWNVFPFHPHHMGNSFSNRCHTAKERRSVEPLLTELIEILEPRQIVAIGNDAETGLLDLGLECAKLRHPSYGGVADFTKGVAILHNLPSFSPTCSQPSLI